MTRNRITDLAILLALLTPTDVLAQQRTIYSNDGRVVGRYTTDSQAPRPFTVPTVA